MDANCAKCGTHLALTWTFCPNCGAPAPHEVHAHEHQHHPVRGAFGGLYYGLIAAPILIVPGILLCLLGWGIFLGLPMIVLGVLAPLYGPIFGMNEHKGKCPSCGTRMISVDDAKEHECPMCSKKFAIVEHENAAAVRATVWLHDVLGSSLLMAGYVWGTTLGVVSTAVGVAWDEAVL